MGMLLEIRGPGSASNSFRGMENARSVFRSKNSSTVRASFMKDETDSRIDADVDEECRELLPGPGMPCPCDPSLQMDGVHTMAKLLTFMEL